jgi:spore coat polysaccharide biosynthesis protein SpsF (cytidylyltransferase family)
MKIPAFITVRTMSKRLPRKCLLPFGDVNVLEHVIKRVKYFGLDPIVCTTIEDSDDVIEKIALKEKTKLFRGSTLHKLKRWLDCCDIFRIKKFHTIDADDPFFDADLIRNSFDLLNKGYDVVYPTESSSAGAASVGFSMTRDIVDKACKLTGDNKDTEMMWYYLEKIPGLKSIKLQEVSNPVRVRLTLDYEEDYWLLYSIARIVGGMVPRKEVDNLFRRNPDLYKINWFRNEEWKEVQLKQKII